MPTLNDWLNYQQKLHNKPIDLGLERISIVYNKLFPNGVNFKVITIAGTNGKGSTGGFISNTLALANIKYGWFSSPHLLQYNERFNLNKTFATDDEIIIAFKKIEQVRDTISLSYFEFSTLAALLIFTRKKVEIAILEVGLGGRLDSVNIVEPDVSIITSIGLDHCNYLGNTLTQIATEKAGIMRTNKPCILPTNITKTLFTIAKTKNATIHKVKKYQPALTMLGDWQKYNASLAKKAIEILTKINLKTIQTGLQTTKVVARAEIVQYQQKEFMFDVAHNLKAVANLKTLLKPNTIAIFAALADKDISAMINAIESKIKKWYLIPLIGERVLSTKDLKSYFTQQKTIICKSSEEAITKVMTTKYKNIVVFGSFLTIVSVKEIIITPSF